MKRLLLVILAGVLAYVVLGFYAPFGYVSIERTSASVVAGA
jgi:hypothetical protein